MRVSLALVLTATASVFVAPAHQAAAAEDFQCKSSVFFSGVPASGVFLKYLHNAPEDGSWDWETPSQIGSGWFGRVLAGPDGRRYTIQDNGEFRRLRYTNGAWDTNPDGTQYQVIGTGWSLPAYRNRITFDAKGDLYAVPNDGNLWWYRYNETAKTWTKRIIAANWGHYDLIVAAGAGVIYARDPRTNGGFLVRHQYDSGAQRWVNQGKAMPGSGWNIHMEIFSPGADILYGKANDPNRTLWWYRYRPSTDTWDTQRRIGEGWGSAAEEWQVSAETDACTLTLPGPVRPPYQQVDSLARTELIEGRNGLLNGYYVNGNAQVVVLQQRAGSDVSYMEASALPTVIEGDPSKTVEFTTTPSALLDKNNKPRVFGLAADGDSYEADEADAWFRYKPYVHQGGWTTSTPKLTRYDDGRLQLFAVDVPTGRLLERHQSTVDGPLLPWQVLAPTGLAGWVDARTVGANAVEVITSSSSGKLTSYRYENGVLGQARSVSGTAITNRPALVVHPDNRLQLFARQSDGKIYTLRDTASGYEGVWRALPDLPANAGLANGSPAAARNEQGYLKVAVRASNKYVYHTEETAPGSQTFKPWKLLLDHNTQQAWPTDTEPAMVALKSGKTVIGYRNLDEVIFTFESGPVVTAAATSSAAQPEIYSGGPAPKK